MVRRPPKSQGRDHITRLIEAGGIPAFNPAQGRPRGRYMCRTVMGGCGHRHARAPGTLCDDCAARHAARASTQAAAEERQHREQLARRRWGEDWDDPANWRADHALAAPRTPREQADRSRSEQARQHVGLEQRERRRGQSWRPWEERPPRIPERASLPRQLRQARQAVADRIEASRIEDPALREMLDRWRAAR
jgi:hypothetical protein